MGILDRIAAAGRAITGRGSPASPALEPEVVPSGETEMRSYLERALLSGDMGMTAVSMSGAQPAQRRGNIEVMRSYSTGPHLRKVVGRISTSCAAPPWRLFAAPRIGQAALPRQVDYLAARASGVRFDRRPQDFGPGGLFGVDHARAVREAHLMGELIEIQRHPWSQLMTRPNAVMSGRVARQVTVAANDLVGDAAWVLGGDGVSEVPTKAWPIPGIWIQRRPTMDEPWWIIQVGAGSGSTSISSSIWNVPWDALLLFTDPDPLQPYGRGVGLGYTAADEVDIDEAAAKTVSAFFQNGAMPATLVSIKGARRDVLERAKREWNNLLQGFRKAYKAHFTGGEINVQRMDNNFKDMTLVEIRKAQGEIIAQLYGVPPEIFGNNTTSSWATSSAASAIMATEVVVPRLEVMREQFQRLADYYDPRLIVAYDSPVPADKDNRRAVMAAHPVYFRVNEIRAAADEDPLPGPQGRGFIDKDGVWWGDLAALSPAMQAFDVMGGIPSVDERRQQLRLPPLGADAGGNEPSPRRVAKVGSIEPTDPNLPPDQQPDTSVGEAAPAASPAPPAPATAAPPPAKAAPTKNRDAKTSLTADDLRHITNAVDVASMYEELRAPIGDLVKTWGQETIDALDLEDDLAFSTDAAPVRKHMRELGSVRVGKFINATTRDAVKDALHKAEREWHQAQSEKARGVRVDDPESFVDALSIALERVFGIARDSRADTIGRSEATHSSGFAGVQALVQAPIRTKEEWIATPDDLVRDEHLELDGQQVDPGDYFQTSSGARALHPGGFGDPALDANCRCVIGTVVLDDDTEEPRGLFIGLRMLSPGADHEARRAAWQASEDHLHAWDERIARAARDGFDRQHVRVLAALKDVLG